MTADAEPASVFDRQRRRLTIGLLLAVFAFAIEGMGVVPALPTAVRALDGLPLFGWVFSAFMLASLVGTIAAGQIVDTRGLRLPMALGICGFGGGLLLAAMARDMAQFLSGRVLQGLGGGAVVAVAYAAIARGYPDALRPRILALFSTVWVVPALVGPLISGAVAERASWRWVFAGILPFLALAAALVLPAMGRFTLPSPLPSKSRVPAALGVALGMGLLLATPSLRQRGILVAIFGGAAGVALLYYGLRPLIPTGTLRGRRGLPMGVLSRGILAFSFFGSEAFLPFGAGELRGVTATAAGLALTTGSLGWIVASWVQDRVEARGGAKMRLHCVFFGYIFEALGMALVGVALTTKLPFWLIPLGWAIGGAGIGLAYSAVGLLCFAMAPAGEEGTVSGQIQLFENLGTAAGTGLGGALLLLATEFGRPARQAIAVIFICTVSMALVGALFSHRILAADR